MNFSAQPGECVAITGPSGSGKSTLVKIVAGLIEPSAGEIKIDGVSPTAETVGLAAVLQTDKLVSNTIRENVRLFRRDATDTDIHAALSLADLGDFMSELPMGLDTPVAEGKGGISGGQRQRILIARSLLGYPKVLILDEATSNLGVESEAKVLRNIKCLGVTMIVCAHRPELWKHADSLYTLREGTLVRIGGQSADQSAVGAL